MALIDYTVVSALVLAIPFVRHDPLETRHLKLMFSSIGSLV